MAYLRVKTNEKYYESNTLLDRSILHKGLNKLLLTLCQNKKVPMLIKNRMGYNYQVLSKNSGGKSQ